MNEPKKPYCRIDWNEDCDLDYGFTICEWSELSSQLESVENDFTGGIDEAAFENNKPAFTVSLVFLTDKEFGDAIDSYHK